MPCYSMLLCAKPSLIETDRQEAAATADKFRISARLKLNFSSAYRGFFGVIRSDPYDFSCALRQWRGSKDRACIIVIAETVLKALYVSAKHGVGIVMEMKTLHFARFSPSERSGLLR